MSRPALFARSALVLFLAVTAAAAPAQEGRPPAVVTVETMQAQDVVLTSTLPGRVRASAQAEVRPQVSGIIIERLFEEGTHVEEGDVLYRIDRATYEAALASAEASVAQAEAQLRAAEREADRMQTLSERGISSQSNEDAAVSTRDGAIAQLKMAEAQLSSARIDLDRTDVRARIAGEVGFSLASVGELVTGSQANPLTTIRKLDPVDVDVTQSAADLINWRRDAAQGGTPGTGQEATLTLADGSSFDQSGTLRAAEPHVDEQTGVIVLRMSFDNPDGLLLPGMYVQVEMPTATAEDVFLVPQEGVTRDRRGNPLALVVNDENTVEQRPLTILQDLGSDWVVTGGLASGDRVIVAGSQNTAPGGTVTPQERGAEDGTAGAGDEAPDGEAPASEAPVGDAAEAAAEGDAADEEAAPSQGAEAAPAGAPDLDVAPADAESDAAPGAAAGSDDPEASGDESE
ncbi:efflux RND transporter periplasmic adaptor subunit [Roseicyclus sp. F158]|uniref:Efflux RND transporter periplasmic adaptor subunit n=1 Tax=Tropicimonas omnivorans TaxID=3075590 RepID=A0ABU3DKI9_9RHOB|nr:efflux RND transporter periplasmic adaptor subunit [Roseicyclus sp. F158]MDT0684212.1 efflux RND transporter periplasmic adaptor subunit [Roseicyclus sp. F158]